MNDTKMIYIRYFLAMTTLSSPILFPIRVHVVVCKL